MGIEVSSVLLVVVVFVMSSLPFVYWLCPVSWWCSREDSEEEEEGGRGGDGGGGFILSPLEQVLSTPGVSLELLRFLQPAQCGALGKCCLY